MMTWIFSGLIVLSVVFSLFNGQVSAVSNAVITGANDAVTLCLSLLGIMAVWSGVMKVAQQAGLTQKLSRLLRPVMHLLFKGLPDDSPAYEYMCMNVVANLLGLGNAATPLGLLAMRELDRENRYRTVASRHMIVFVVLNTASLQLIPTTTAALRLQNGSKAPMEILPAVWITTLCALLAALTVAFVLGKISEAKDGKAK